MYEKAGSFLFGSAEANVIVPSLPSSFEKQVGSDDFFVADGVISFDWHHCMCFVKFLGVEKIQDSIARRCVK